VTHRLKVFENGILRGIFTAKEEKLKGKRKKYITRSFIIVFFTEYYEGD
jgi:hypothetical protein